MIRILARISFLSAWCCTKWQQAASVWRRNRWRDYRGCSDAAARFGAKHQSDIPPRLEEIIDEALRKNRDQRYQSAADLLADLDD